MVRWSWFPKGVWFKVSLKISLNKFITQDNHFVKRYLGLFNGQHSWCSIHYRRLLYCKPCCWISEWSMGPIGWLEQRTEQSWFNHCRNSNDDSWWRWKVSYDFTLLLRLWRFWLLIKLWNGSLGNGERWQQGYQSNLIQLPQWDWTLRGPFWLLQQLKSFQSKIMLQNKFSNGWVKMSF